jgi:hypothetical protein
MEGKVKQVENMEKIKASYKIEVENVNTRYN